MKYYVCLCQLGCLFVRLFVGYNKIEETNTVIIPRTSCIPFALSYKKSCCSWTAILGWLAGRRQGWITSSDSATVRTARVLASGRGQQADLFLSPLRLPVCDWLTRVITTVSGNWEQQGKGLSMLHLICMYVFIH